MLIPFRPPKTHPPYVLVNVPNGEFCAILNAKRKLCRGIQDEHSRALIVTDGTILAFQGNRPQSLEFYIVRSSGNGGGYGGYLIRLQYHEIADQLAFNEDVHGSHISHMKTSLLRTTQPPMYDVDSLKYAQDIRLSKQVVTYLFPTRLREDFLKYHDNRTCVALSKNEGTGKWYEFDKRPIQLDDPEGTIYVIETAKNEYVAYHFVDNLEDDKLMLWGKNYCNLIQNGGLVIDGSTGISSDDREITFEITPIDSVNTAGNLRELFENLSDSQRRDITEWNKIIEENSKAIWVVDAYFDTRKELSSPKYRGDY